MYSCIPAPADVLCSDEDKTVKTAGQDGAKNRTECVAETTMTISGERVKDNFLLADPYTL